jgi:RNA polymerase sigma-70 factor (ECF subfamily)
MECFWDNLYRQVGPDLLAFFTRRHGQVHLAEDLLQNTFVQAMRREARVREAVSPRAYLFGIARHLSQEEFRHPPMETEVMPELAAETAPVADPRLEAMREAMDKLPAGQREVLELRLRHELSYEETAAVLRIPIGTVRSRLHLAVRHLRDLTGKTPQASDGKRLL